MIIGTLLLDSGGFCSIMVREAPFLIVSNWEEQNPRLYRASGF